MSRSFKRVGAMSGLSVLVFMLGACQQGDEPPASPRGAATVPREPPGPAHPDVSAAVAKVIDDAHHPRLTWPDIPDVAPLLETLYDAEADRLFWFAGEEAYPVLADAIEALGRVDEHGLDPADYDAARLGEMLRIAASRCSRAAARSTRDRTWSSEEG